MISLGTTPRKTNVIGHFRVPKNLTLKLRLSAKLLIWKWFLIMMQIKLIFTTKVSHLASFWKWDFLELGNGLFESMANVSNSETITRLYACPSITLVKLVQWNPVNMDTKVTCHNVCIIRVCVLSGRSEKMSEN